ncbi:receptor-like protein EIX2 [Neltuma alba]|uniref:receptor-like protein EIX2 n=1 Tax=Neltuma alba TaxID=207710 RepID=UPI0010A50255|nr:receptor-like protein EIX2 [Prosopis alba]
MTGRVTELSLFNHTLRGDINLCVLQLEFLNHLDLSHNDFKTVSMPPCQISKSPFDAHKFHNQSLATPSNHSASFSIALRYLNFSHNYILVIKDLHWLSQLSSLKYLDLTNNDIGSEIKWLHHIAMLPALSELHLSDSGLGDFPSHDYINLTSLEVLDLSDNFYIVNSKLPDSLFNITHHIHHLDLSGCNFHGQLPKSFFNLKNLKYLDFHSNNLEGLIPDWFGQYEQLQSLDISENLFHGAIPSSLGNISSLFYLDLSYNELNGNIPVTLGQLHNLIDLYIGHNFLVGVLTENFFAGLSSLKSMDLSSNSFKSDFDPKWVPSFQLETLGMGNTSIGPTVPLWLYTQQSLRELYISKSRISTIDKDIFWNFVAGIEYVDISNNLISDDISDVILSANVSYFYASHSSLSGSIFSLLCQLEGNGESNLAELDLSYNHLSGALPDCWTNRKSLEFLSLGSNKLIGKVPPSFASLGLQQLDLSDNSFSGEFSSSTLNWTNLQFLILEKNNFSGSLPNLYMARSLKVLKLRTNQFMGNIPPGICMLSSLQILELANNKFFGSIPSCLCNITNPNNIALSFYLREMMRIFTKGRELDYQPHAYFTSGVIDLSANSLSGEIPKELFSITLLWSLNLSRNHLTGKIPKEIGALENLESLDLSYNRLSGEIPSTIFLIPRVLLAIVNFVEILFQRSATKKKKLMTTQSQVKEMKTTAF